MEKAPDPVVAMTEAPGPEPPIEEPVSPAHARLGSEGLARLRARYADVQAAISRRVQDEERRGRLKAEAERLDPDGWVTDDEVTTGLEQYESVLASLRDVIGRRRRRRRGRGTARPSQETAAPERTESLPEGEEDDPGSGI